MNDVDQPRLPAGSQSARRTPTFDQDSVPPALLKEHHTTVWAELVVLRGQVWFEATKPPRRVEVAAGARAVIVPDQRHHIEPGDDSQFYVQFYDPPAEPDQRS